MRTLTWLGCVAVMALALIGSGANDTPKKGKGEAVKGDAGAAAEPAKGEKPAAKPAAAEALPVAESIAVDVSARLVDDVQTVIDLNHKLQELKDQKLDSPNNKGLDKRITKLGEDVKKADESLKLTMAKETKKLESESKAKATELDKLYKELEGAKGEREEKVRATIDKVQDEQQRVTDALGAVKSDLATGKIEDKESIRGLQEGDAPRFTVDLLDGKTFKYDEDLGDNALVIMFWSLRNKGSMRALEAFEGMAARYSHDKIKFLAINVGDSKTQVQDAVGDKKAKALMGADTLQANKQGLGQVYKVRLVPSFLLVAKNREVRLVQVGTSGSQMSALRSGIGDMFAEEQKDQKDREKK